MSPIVTWAGRGFLAVSLLGAGYALLAAGLVRRYFRARIPAAPPAEPVTLFKPLHGAEPELLQNLQSFCDQDYESPVQIVFGVQSEADPAIEIVRELRAQNPARDIELAVDSRAHGPNAKVSNLVNMAGRAKHPVLVISDSDIRARPDYLSRITAPLAEPEVGVVTCLYYGRPRTGLWSRLSAMGLSYGFLPNAVLGVSLGLANPCFGSTIALRRSVLAAIGGFEALADHLADDYEIGRAARRLGLRVAVPPMLVEHGCAERSFRQLFVQELRWAFTIRRIEGPGYAGSVVTHALPLGLIGAALTGFVPAGLAVLAAAAVSRLVVMVAVDRETGARGRDWALMPLRDLLSFAVFIGSFCTDTVQWRGRRLRVGRDGRLRPSEDIANASHPVPASPLV